MHLLGFRVRPINEVLEQLDLLHVALLLSLKLIIFLSQIPDCKLHLVRHFLEIENRHVFVVDFLLEGGDLLPVI